MDPRLREDGSLDERSYGIGDSKTKAAIGQLAAHERLPFGLVDDRCWPVSAGVLGGSGRSGPGDVLRWKFKAGEVLRYSVEQKMAR